jgi:hypothetical protein
LALNASIRVKTASVEKLPDTDWKLSPLRYKRGVLKAGLLREGTVRHP